MNLYKITLTSSPRIVSYVSQPIDSIVNFDFDELDDNQKYEIRRDGILYVYDHKVIIDMDYYGDIDTYLNYIAFRNKVLVQIKKDKLKEFLK